MPRGNDRGKNVHMDNRDRDVDAWFETYDNPHRELVQAVRGSSLALTRT